MRPVQYFTPEYLAGEVPGNDPRPDHPLRRGLPAVARRSSARRQAREVTAGQPQGAQDLLNAFKTKARLSGRPYQSQIKELMKAWLIGE